MPTCILDCGKRLKSMGFGTPSNGCPTDTTECGLSGRWSRVSVLWVIRLVATLLSRQSDGPAELSVEKVGALIEVRAASIYA